MHVWWVLVMVFLMVLGGCAPRASEQRPASSSYTPRPSAPTQTSVRTPPSLGQKPPFQEQPVVPPAELNQQDHVVYTKGWLLRERYRKAFYDASWQQIEVVNAEVNMVSSSMTIGDTQRLMTPRRQELAALQAVTAQAKRDFELFEIEVRSQYGGQVPTWWAPIRVDASGKDLFR